ncbi:hypothetical protein BS50DRAFT_614455 [Corynespora cassiicola Philippines]|uniref:Box C/D snoRNA protein 1 n=1 Tax=Corynespora cassiicola Philippines TaxID=1448308 RepID=A0A2T2N436_CORCC|nr:hypothetical protein BS50DRAFT_614455 [Corynespora cassiicola Philippines]
MADETLLSGLCSICNTTKFKYRCPGCDARTCSLPCYKRHQQWAQCSGKRDPTKFVKKSQLATPAGIDHDFNFLTGVERGLEKAEHTHYAAAGVEVIRAPKGLSRQKENKTRRSNQGNIVWTVEWLREDKSRILAETPEGCPISESHPFERHQHKGLSRKRKRPAHDQPPSSKEEVQDAPTLPVDQGELQRVKAEAAEREPPPAGPGRPSSRDGHAESVVPKEYNVDAELADDSRSSPRLAGADSESVPPEYHYFLLRPRTSSSRQVLVPISASATLAECLRGRTVLEFPTIYVFSGPDLQLPQDFMLESEYLKQQGEEEKELSDLLKGVDPETLKAIGEQRSEEDIAAGEPVDSSAILDVLKRDLGARGHE